MSVENPPLFYFNGITFNNSFFNTGSISTLTKGQANTLYLRKTVPDTTSVLETFNGGLNTSDINPISTTVNIIPGVTSGRTLNLLNGAQGSIFIGANISGASSFLNSETINIGQPSGASNTNIRSLTTNITNGVSTPSVNSIANTLDLQGGSTNSRILNLMTASQGTINVGTSSAGSVLNLNSDVVKLSNPIEPLYLPSVAASGEIGFVISSNVTTNLTTGGVKNLTSISLTRGVWMVVGSTNPVFSASGSYFAHSLSTVSLAFNDECTEFQAYNVPGGINATLSNWFKFDTTTTVFYVYFASTNSSTSNNSYLRAIRIA